MTTCVCKFGGSSVCDADMFLRVQAILAASPDRRFIVLSAPGRRTPDDIKITDLLYRAYTCGAQGDQFILAQIFQRYTAMRDRLAPSFDLEYEFACIRKECSTSADHFVSRGEYLCAKLFSAFTGLPFVDASELFFFSGDSIDLSETLRRSRERLSGMTSAVIPGFYGMSPTCGIKTFARGGSDVSGALLAAALHADRYENWTDVDGLYTADPNLVPEARRSRVVSLRQLRAIAQAGAGILHPDALAPLEDSGIETIIKNTCAPDDPGTRVIDGTCPPVPCVTGRCGMYMLANPTNPAQSPLLYATPVADARRVAVISVFGLDDADDAAIRALVDPIDIIHMQDHKQIIIDEPQYAASVRKIHSLLMSLHPTCLDP